MEIIMERVALRQQRRKTFSKAYPDWEKDIVQSPLEEESED